MSFTDPVADLLTRIRNAHMRGHTVVKCGSSKLAKSILEVLKNEGYITSYREEEVRAGVSQLVIDLRYFEGQPAIKSLRRVSKPGRRIYSPIGTLRKVLNGLGVSVLSTSHGVISDATARQLNVGGEVLFEVY